MVALGWYITLTTNNIITIMILFRRPTILLERWSFTLSKDNVLLWRVKITKYYFDKRWTIIYNFSDGIILLMTIYFPSTKIYRSANWYDKILYFVGADIISGRLLLQLWYYTVLSRMILLHRWRYYTVLSRIMLHRSIKGDITPFYQGWYYTVLSRMMMILYRQWWYFTPSMVILYRRWWYYSKEDGYYSREDGYYSGDGDITARRILLQGGWILLQRWWYYCNDDDILLRWRRYFTPAMMILLQGEYYSREDITPGRILLQ